MDFAATIDALRRTALRRGEFELHPDASLSTVIRKAAVPACAGVYVITAPGGEVLYVGRSGTVHQDGSLGEQGISGRLQKKQGGLTRQAFFRAVMSDRGLKSLHFEWFETYHDHRGTPPFLAEAELLAAHLADWGQLPVLNGAA